MLPELFEFSQFFISAILNNVNMYLHLMIHTFKIILFPRSIVLFYQVLVATGRYDLITKHCMFRNVNCTALSTEYYGII